ncbi:MAG: endolytic transglycosylase MltG [Clostridia bacterium]|nr:endolytic transglycosylase MltG [Clostridia bacterium]
MSRGETVLICLGIAITLTVIISLLAHEIFALGKIADEENAIELTLESETNTAQLARVLKDNGAIGSRTLFCLYSRLRGKEGVYSPGEYTVTVSSGYDGILRRMRGGGAIDRRQISVTVPEGSTIKDILRIVCDEKGVCSRKDLEDAIQNGDFSKYRFVKELEEVDSSARIYRLEGYLYPDTYYFYTDSSGYTVVDRMLSNFERHFDDKYRKACESKGMTVDAAVTLASIIMKEAKNVSDYPLVSSVFHNRMNSKGFGKRLQSDATLTYALGRPMVGGDKEVDSPFNTYLYPGYPPSAICNPDMNAISYALCPDRSSYFYFISDKSGDVHFATTYDQHRRNVAKYS